MTRYINSKKYWHESCKNKDAQLFLTATTAFASLRQMVDVERVSAILSLRAVIQKMTLPLSIADLT